MRGTGRNVSLLVSAMKVSKIPKPPPAISIHRLAGATNIAQALRTAMRNPNIAHQLTGL